MSDLLADHVYCHIFLAHAADGKLDDEEIMAVRDCTQTIAGQVGHSAADVDALVGAGVDRYWETLAEEGPGGATQAYEAAAGRLLTAMGTGQGASVLVDTLARVAAADGHTDDMETLLIQGMVRRWQTQYA